MNLKNLIPYNPAGKYDLPKMLELQESPLSLSPDAMTILQPKYDGCQAIFIPTAKDDTVVYVPVTRKGNLIHRLVPNAERFTSSLQGDPTQPVLFAEYEPVPWSDDNKAKLAGNLYTSVPLDFSARIVIFDAINNNDFVSDKMKASPTKERLVYLDSLKPNLPEAEVSPWKELSYKDAIIACRASRIETSEGTRCMVLGVLCEGGVIRHGVKGQKEKPTIDKDVAVLGAVVSAKGQPGWIAVDTKQPTKEGLMLIFGGVSPQNHKNHINEVVEVKMLTVSGFKGAGNPTFARTRVNEKDADFKALRKELDAPIKQMIKDAKLKEVPIGPSFDI